MRCGFSKVGDCPDGRETMGTPHKVRTLMLKWRADAKQHHTGYETTTVRPTGWVKVYAKPLSHCPDPTCDASHAWMMADNPSVVVCAHQVELD